ncbi:DNA-binding death effector domain-containing protein 2 isoform X1 [Choloepus didactylus]|uniref:DNA-binding death effector domain-containing protein 2 isoform X1 n=1 Tax=Choloepus didactylus TaxID=27675 RepID=UPI00189CD46F|nr:DNA-binding death effector domain-containing protein 2 isoform X1 [Choloepus didactylus]
MALPGSTLAPSWEEDECLDYYGMLSLHRMFEVVGGQLTECELELLAFLLDEAPGAAGGLARARSGLELLLELERRGQCDESNLRLLRQLLRVLARHDLLPHLARKRRRPVSPERYSSSPSSPSSKMTEGSCRRRRHQSSSSSSSQQGQWETGSPPTKRQRRSRGRPSGGARRRRRGGPVAPQQPQEPARPASEGKVTCGLGPSALQATSLNPCVPRRRRDLFFVCLCFSGGETEAQRGEVTCPRPQVCRTPPPGSVPLPLTSPGGALDRHPAPGSGRILRARAGLGAGCGVPAAPGTGATAGRVRAGHGGAALAGPGLRGVRHQVLGALLPGRLLG